MIPKQPSLHERFLSGSEPRVRTGIAALDDACAGGLILGKRVVLGGAPGALKTMLATQLAVDIARQGCQVVVLASDECANAVAVRMGQLAGCDRRLLESGDPESASRAAGALATIPLTLVEDLTIEAAGRLLGHSGPRCLILDSLQTVRCNAHTTGAKGKKSRVEASVEALGALAQAGILCIATSELNRDGYKGKKKPGLDSAKGSGDVEYAFDMFLALQCTGPGITHVTTPKNRLGEKPEFDLFLDEHRARLYTENQWDAMNKPAQPARTMPALDLHPQVTILPAPRKERSWFARTFLP